jgi:hypothetical protein
MNDLPYVISKLYLSVTLWLIIVGLVSAVNTHSYL